MFECLLEYKKDTSNTQFSHIQRLHEQKAATSDVYLHEVRYVRLLENGQAIAMGRTNIRSIFTRCSSYSRAALLQFLQLGPQEEVSVSCRHKKYLCHFQSCECVAWLQFQNILEAFYTSACRRQRATRIRVAIRAAKIENRDLMRGAKWWLDDEWLLEPATVVVLWQAANLLLVQEGLSSHLDGYSESRGTCLNNALKRAIERSQ